MMLEYLELRWTRPDGAEAVSVVMQYDTQEEAMDAVDRCLMALEEMRHERSRSHVAVGHQAVEP